MISDNFQQIKAILHFFNGKRRNAENLKFRNFWSNDLQVTLVSLNCLKQLCMNCIKLQKQLIDISATFKHELHGICDGVTHRWRERTTKKQFLRSGLRKLQDRSTQDFMSEDIHLKGTFTEILEEIQQVAFEKKFKKHLKRKIILELCASNYFTFGLETLSLRSEFIQRLKQGES